MSITASLVKQKVPSNGVRWSILPVLHDDAVIIAVPDPFVETHDCVKVYFDVLPTAQSEYQPYLKAVRTKRDTTRALEMMFGFGSLLYPLTT